MTDMTRIDFGRRLAERFDWVEPDATEAQVIQALADNGITAQASNFRNGDTITRAEAATMFVRASGGDGSDLSTGLSQAVDSGIFTTTGDPEQAFQTEWFDRTASRADAGLVDWSTVRDFPEWKSIVEERFPGWAWAFDHPELGPLLEESAEGEFTAATFEARLRATDWYTSRTTAERAWDAREADPANEADLERETVERMGEIRDLAGQLGTSGLEEDGLRALAVQSLRQGLSTDEIMGSLVAGYADYSAGSLAGAAADVRRLASDYLVTVDDETQRTLAGKLATGELNADGVTAYVTNVARNQFPQFADMIDQGISLREYTAPQRSVLANMLGRNPEDIDLTGEFRDVLSIGDGGQVRAMSLSETERYARTRDEFWRGRAGQDELQGMVNGLTRALGVRR